MRKPSRIGCRKMKETRSFSLDDIDWRSGVSRTRDWSPGEIAPMTYLSGFERLSPDVRRRYNQLFALGVCEQFIWFERDLLGPILKEMIRTRSDLGQPMLAELQVFLDDEEKHSEMFWRLLETAEPEFYPERRFRFLNLGRLQAMALGLMTAFPNVMPVWLWAALFFEERTLDYSRRYRNLGRLSEGSIDSLFARCHILHLQDESRHHDIDQRLIATMYAGLPRWKRAFTGWLMYRLMKAFVSPKRVSKRILAVLRTEFPAAGAELDVLERELPLIRESTEFRKVAFGMQAVGSSRRLMAQYSEMKRALALFD